MCLYITLKVKNSRRCLMVYNYFMNGWNFDLSLKILHDPEVRLIVTKYGFFVYCKSEINLLMIVILLWFSISIFFQIRLIVQVCFNKYILLFYSLHVLDPQCRYNFQDTKRDNVVHWHRRLRGYDWRIRCNYCQGVCSVRIDT